MNGKCGNGRSYAYLTAQFERKKKRLQSYYEKEEELLSSSNVRKYAIGSRNVERYEVQLKNIQDAISRLEKDIEYLQSQLCGQGARKAMGAIPRDW